MGMSRISSSLGRTARATILAVIGLATVSAVGAVAQTAEQRAACTPDALRLCSSAIPDVGRVTACMQAHRTSLSARCQALMPGAPSTTQVATRPQRERVAVAPQMQRRVVTGGHHRRVVVAETRGTRHHRRVAGGGFGFGGGGSRQGMAIALQVMSALSAACQTQSASSQMCGAVNSMGSMGGMGGMGALAGFIK